MREAHSMSEHMIHGEGGDNIEVVVKCSVGALTDAANIVTEIHCFLLFFSGWVFF
jgi:hypothetical protein